MTMWHEVHIEFGENLIKDQCILVLRLYAQVRNVALDLSKIKIKTNEYGNRSLGVKGKIGLYIVEKNSMNNDKEQLRIKLDDDISEEDFKKYFKLFVNLPPECRVSAGSWIRFDGDYSMKTIREVTVFNNADVKKYGKDYLLSYPDAKLTKELDNGSVLVWIGKHHDVSAFTATSDDIRKFVAFLRREE